LKLAGGFAREIKRAVEVTSAELAERKLEQDAGFPEAGGRFKENERVTFKRGGEVRLRRLLSGTRLREGRAKRKVAQTFARTQPQVEKLSDAFELDAKKCFVGWAEGQRLREARRDFDEDKFSAED